MDAATAAAAASAVVAAAAIAAAVVVDAEVVVAAAGSKRFRRSPLADSARFDFHRRVLLSQQQLTLLNVLF